jgi:tetratricopeptide (TPR) repeat protein
VVAVAETAVVNQGEGGRVALGDLWLDLDGGTLTRDGRIVNLRAKPFQLLCHLVRNPGRVLSKDDLLAAVWPGVLVTEDSLTQAIREIRLALGSAAAAVRTVPRRGYIYDPGPEAAPAVGAARMPRIIVRAVVPAGLPADRADMPALVRDALLGGLARFRSLHVAAGEVEDGADEADYAVEGVLWSDGTGAVLRLKLVELARNRIAWSETFACGPGPDPDPEAARRIVGTLHGAIEFDCELRSARRATVSPTAWEHFVRGLSVSDSTRPEKLDEAATALAAATEADPGFGLAWSFRAYAEFARHDYLMAPDAVKDQVREMAERGAALAPDEARALSMLGYVLLLLGEFHPAEARIATAYRLNPPASTS